MTACQLEELKKTARCQMEQDRQRLLMKFPFTGGVMMRLELIPVRDRRLATAATDGSRIFMDIAFFMKLPLDERLFVLAHEVWHCVYLHMLRQQGRDSRRFNVAADMEVNRMLVRESFRGPHWCLYPKKEWSDLSAEEIYELLPQKESRMPLDRHLARESSEGGGMDESQSEAEQGFGVSDQWGEKGLDSDFEPEIPANLAERIRESVLSVAQQLWRCHGKIPGHLEEVVRATLKPQIRWQEVLAQFVTSAYGGTRRWLPPSRRHIHRGLYLQSTRRETLKAVVVVDTSGSVTAYLPQFFSELNGLLASFGEYELTVIQCDAEIQNVRQYGEGNPPDGHEWTTWGHGGTSFCPPFDYVRAHPELKPSCLIYITDGFGDAPDAAPAFPVLWLVPADGRFPARWGLRVRLDSTDRGNMHSK